jgi:hypothetical protein
MAMVLPGESLSSPGGKFTVARLKYSGGGDWYADPSSLPNLLRELKERTDIEVGEREARVKILDDELFSYPFVYLTGHGKVSFSDEEAERLAYYLDSGGFLWADDNYGMDEYFRREMKKVFPTEELVELPFGHEIYHSFYDFSAGPPKIHEHDGKPPRGYGIIRGGRLVVFYTYESDIGDGLEDAEVHDDPPDKREAAVKMATNIVVYAMTH